MIFLKFCMKLALTTAFQVSDKSYLRIYQVLKDENLQECTFSNIATNKEVVFKKINSCHHCIAKLYLDTY